MPRIVTLDGVKCVQYNIATGEAKKRTCVYCGRLVKKARGRAHTCNSRISKICTKYVNDLFAERSSLITVIH
jgi:hypothetical protein